MDRNNKKDFFDNFSNNNQRAFQVLHLPHQQIFYGAPGTGKSHTIKVATEACPKENVVRTTFHPDSDYSTFVGAYKPAMQELPRYNPQTGERMGEEKKIVYAYTPQAFLKAYVKAWQVPEEPVFLIIEEINRGNCAQIFGDLFQLLDREEGISEYPIKADQDMQQYLTEALSGCEGLDEKIRSGEELVLPPNLYIWATMNTSDQSLFPIDSAFKRRWEWKYVKIKNHPEENYQIKLSDTDKRDWWEFVKQVNRIIASMTSSADKQLGYFFCKADADKVISADKFVSKVLFYLWNDVFKDYGFEDASLFRYADTEEPTKTHELTFPDFYDEDGEKVNIDRVADFIDKVMAWDDNQKQG
ncbi:MAG: AAA family ATPase [Bacteroidaceae bacterium]|nr:AAA family ATPase [Bacteroidaceae bacterium]